MSGSPGRVLIADDGEDDRESLRRAFRDSGWDVTTAGDADEAMSCARLGTFQLFVIDLGKTDGVGLLLLTKLRRQHPVVPIVLLATTANLETAVEAVQLGATSYLAKPTTVEVIATAVGRAELIRRRTPDSLDESMRAHIRRVLADCGYNKSEAAKRLGIDRRSLQRKMSKLHL